MWFQEKLTLWSPKSSWFIRMSVILQILHTWTIWSKAALATEKNLWVKDAGKVVSIATSSVFCPSTYGSVLRADEPWWQKQSNLHSDFFAWLGARLGPHHRIHSPKLGAFLDPVESVFQGAEDSPSKVTGQHQLVATQTQVNRSPGSALGPQEICSGACLVGLWGRGRAWSTLGSPWWVSLCLSSPIPFPASNGHSLIVET